MLAFKINQKRWFLLQNSNSGIAYSANTEARFSNFWGFKTCTETYPKSTPQGHPNDHKWPPSDPKMIPRWRQSDPPGDSKMTPDVPKVNWHRSQNKASMILKRRQMTRKLLILKEKYSTSRSSRSTRSSGSTAFSGNGVRASRTDPWYSTPAGGLMVA